MVRVRTHNAIYYQSRYRLEGQANTEAEQQMATDEYTENRLSEQVVRRTHKHQLTTHNLQRQKVEDVRYTVEGTSRR